jgi:hypothetical protein
MDHADGGWTVVNESKIDGSCNCPEGQDDEAMSQPDKIEKRISIQTNDKMLYKAKPYPVSSPGSERQVSALLTSKSPLAYQSGFLSVGDTNDVPAPPSMETDNQHSPSYLHSQGPRLENHVPRMTQVNSVPLTVSTTNTPSPPDQSNCIPRTADISPKIEEWVQICEKYRDRHIPVEFWVTWSRSAQRNLRH